MHGSRVRSSSSGVAMTSPRPHPLARGPRPALSCGPYSVTFSLTNLAQPARATYIVGTTTDHAGALTSAATCRTAGNTTCALRDALIYAMSGTDTIVFRNGIGAVITIAGANGPLMVGANMTITGPGAALLAIDGGGVTVFRVNSGVTATIGGLTIQHGNASGADGGGIANGGTLTVTNSTLSSNMAGGGKGGGIANDGTLAVTNSTLSGNRTDGGDGGGIFNSGTLTVTNSTLRSNGAVSGGGIRNTGTLALIERYPLRQHR